MSLKRKAVVTAFALVIFASLFSVTVYTEPKGIPFEDMWAAVADLQTQITDLVSMVDSRAPKTGAVSYSARDFNTDGHIVDGEIVSVPTAQETYYATVHLPHGVKITKLSFIVSDYMPGEMLASANLRLWKEWYGEENEFNAFYIADVTSVDNPEGIWATRVEKTAHPDNSYVDNACETFGMVLEMPKKLDDNNVIFRAAFIEYEYPP